MRIAFDIKTVTATRATIHFYDARNLSQDPTGSAPLSVSWERDQPGAPWRTPTVATIGLDEDHARALGQLVRRQQELAEAKEPATPLRIIRALQARHGVQVVWDNAAKKFRNVGLMKDGATLYEVVGTSLTVEFGADHQERDVVTRAKRAVTDAMVAEPEKAEALAKWFSGGCKTKKVAHAKAPTAILPAALAVDAEEEALAETPVRKHKEDVDG